MADDPMTAEETRELAREAYTSCFPMLMGYRYAWATFLEPSLPTHRGPVNAILGRAETLGPSFRDVITPNADTPYSMGLLDLRAEPVVLEVPAVPDRYYVIQFVDLYGHNPHYVGSRATGAEAGTYLLTGPGWDGAAPDGVDDVLAFETDLVAVIGRTQLLGPDDVPAVAEVMAGYRLQPLSAWTGTGPPPPPADVDWPAWDDPASRDERFIGYVNALLPFCQPPHPDEVAMWERFARIGIAPGAPFDADALDAEVRTALRDGVDAARAAIAGQVASLGEKVHGWTAVAALGSRAHFAGDHLLRAAGAMAGWGGNDVEEALYPLCREDGEGRALDGAHRYRLTLVTDPPAKAFWSVTVYDTSYDGTAGYLVDNPIDRYLINSTTEGLVRGDDGSLTIHLQHDRPDTEAGRANWLPTPEGPFYLAMRIYWPEPAALDGSWAPPPVERVG